MRFAGAADGKVFRPLHYFPRAAVRITAAI
jgi:hypothetical protein